jgi:2,3-bisphosphoglycerate-independent phosphoglycerate mutase
MAKKPVMLMILDGWGIAPAGPYNAATTARTPHLDSYFADYPNTKLEASGEDVGLPAGQIGNSEVGHLNIGSGRIIYQDLSLISHAIKEGSFFKNQVLLDALRHAKEKNSSLHLMGLFSDGGVHSHIDHLKALLEMAKTAGLQKVYVHAFLDGRDVPPQSAIPYVQDLEAFMQKEGVGCFATVSGRYYAMDRDKRWERLEKAYRNMVLRDGAVFASAAEGIQASYEAGVNDEFVVPFVVKGYEGMKNGDGAIFFNFRPDRARQLTHSFVDETFDGFERDEDLKIPFATFSQYEDGMNALVAFPPESINNTLGEIIQNKGMTQLRIAETEKYAHVTFFFNGGVEEPYKGEDRILVPSPKVATYDLQPEMSAVEVTDKVVEAIKSGKYDFIILNYANCDMVGHTGVFPAVIKAVETVDTCVGRFVDAIREVGGEVCITADHGNADKMMDYENDQPFTKHTTNPVPFIVVSDRVKSVKDGALCDIAPTLLTLAGVEIPAEMTGKNLVEL